MSSQDLNYLLLHSGHYSDEAGQHRDHADSWITARISSTDRCGRQRQPVWRETVGIGTRRPGDGALLANSKILLGCQVVSASATCMWICQAGSTRVAEPATNRTGETHDQV